MSSNRWHAFPLASDALGNVHRADWVPAHMSCKQSATDRLGGFAPLGTPVGFGMDAVS